MVNEAGQRQPRPEVHDAVRVDAAGAAQRVPARPLRLHRQHHRLRAGQLQQHPGDDAGQPRAGRHRVAGADPRDGRALPAALERAAGFAAAAERSMESVSGAGLLRPASRRRTPPTCGRCSPACTARWASGTGRGKPTSPPATRTRSPKLRCRPAALLRAGRRFPTSARRRAHRHRPRLHASMCTTGLPVFQEFTPSDDCITGIETRTRQPTDLTQNIVEANMQGAAFNLPAGEVRFAVGVAWRKNDFRFDPGYPVEQILDNPIGLFASNSTTGSTSVKEVYGEMLVPVIKNLELELGYRLSDFDTAGTVDTYKGLFTLESARHRDVPRRLSVRHARTEHGGAVHRTEPGGRAASRQSDPCSAVTLSPWGNVREQSKPRESAGTVPRASSATAPRRSTRRPTTHRNGPNGFTRQNPPFFPLEIEVTQGNPNVQPEVGRTFTLGAVITDPFGVGAAHADPRRLSHQGDGPDLADLLDDGLQQLLQLQRHQQPDLRRQQSVLPADPSQPGHGRSRGSRCAVLEPRHAGDTGRRRVVQPGRCKRRPRRSDAPEHAAPGWITSATSPIPTRA